MADIETRNIRIANGQGEAESGALTVNIYTKSERLKRAAKILGICWGLALVTLFIPIAHFVLVPSFLLAGPIMAFMRYRVVESVEVAKGRCPTCKRDITLPLDAGQRLPMWTYCPPSNDPIQLVEDRGGSQ